MTATLTKTNKLEEAIKIIRACESKEKEIKELREEQELLIKDVLEKLGVEELQIGAFTVRFTDVVRNNFNTSAFKKKYLELYNAFIKQSNYKKFTIA